ncbi:substrate-binding domain-containing protein [Rhizobium sp. BK376]|uniref:ABC transporter substrate-binding protein n=1 Tax=Rhizobium sp. BK376 TaxID=2512149 RepID=UPI0010440939|nr:substrate-binding domain-containing protein [Rhizobium sp. BK376]TCR71785.1 monosaccharide ABC transporter substrate-binding protein (CUT2 family) [Rhizobium sp. BK376]
MKSIRRRTFGAALAMTTALLGFGMTTSLAHAQGKTYALVQINQQALFFNQINAGAQKAADASGDKLVIFNANNDASAQNSAIETYIQQKVDGLIVVAIDVNGIMPAVNEAAKAGIPVVAIDAVLPDGPQKAQIGVDNGKAGGDIGAYFVDYVKKNMGGKAKVGVVGALNSFIQNLRQKGFENAIKGNDGITTAGVVDGQNIQDNALSAAENLITGNPDMTTIYATGEPALLGAIAAVQSQGKQDSIKIFGWDLTAQAISAIDSGFVVAVVQQDPAGEGKAAVESLAKLSAGGSVEKTISIPITIVTKANVDPYRAMFK